MCAGERIKTVKSSNQMETMGGGVQPQKVVTMDLHNFVATHAGYTYGPVIFATLLAATWKVEAIADFYDAHSLAQWGFANAATYTIFAIWSMFAVHGLVCCYR